jgi:hypothetical protein
MTWSRRAVLGCCLGGVTALAGCSNRDPSDVAGESGVADTATSAPGRRTVNGIEVPVSESSLQRGAGKDAIPAIVDPAFGEDWAGVSYEVQRNVGSYTAAPRLSDDDLVVGVARAGDARAYPLKILNWHEVVNDTLGGPLLVTYCPLCGSAMTAVREVGGEETVFGVSGYLYRNDLVMYDRASDSLWSQIAATAINGPATGATLALLPSSLTTWGEWRATHPETVVLRPPPESNTVRDGSGARDYSRNPYAGYEDSRRIGIGASDFDDERLHPKTTVVGVAVADEAVAYPLPTIQEAGAVDDTVGDLPVVVAATADGTLAAYDRRVAGEALSFERADGAHLRADGSRWPITSGTAVDGPHEGTTLARANDASPMFFFAWTDFHPETAVYGVDRTPASSGTDG